MIELKDKYVLTIVTVVYNDVDNIEKTLKSVERIKSSHIQYIVIDGSSKDGTLEIIKKYNGIIDILVSEKDDGIYDAMNKGLDFAEGTTVVFMNGGDIFHEKFNPIDTITKYDYANFTLIGYSLQTFQEDIYLRPSKNNIKNLLKNPAHQAVFVPKIKYSKIKYNLNYRISADYYWIKEVVNGNEYVVIDDIVAIFSLGGKSTSNKFSDILLMNKEMNLKHIYLKTIIKFLMFNLLGRKLSFRFLYRKKYELLNQKFC